MKSIQHQISSRLVPVLFLTALPALFACADEAGDDADLDLDTEPAVIEEPAMTTAFGDWDANNDTYLTEDEFTTGWETQTVWEDWDANADTYLDEQEFEGAFSDEDWFSDTLWGDWDVNDDDRLDENELRTGLYDTWDADADGQLTEDEFDIDLF